MCPGRVLHQRGVHTLQFHHVSIRMLLRQPLLSRGSGIVRHGGQSLHLLLANGCGRLRFNRGVHVRERPGVHRRTSLHGRSVRVQPGILRHRLLQGRCLPGKKLTDLRNGGKRLCSL